MISLNEERCLICQKFAKSGEPWCRKCLMLPEQVRLSKTFWAKRRRKEAGTA